MFDEVDEHAARAAWAPSSPRSTCLARRGALPVDEAVDFVLQACEAVNELRVVLDVVRRVTRPSHRGRLGRHADVRRDAGR